MAQDRFHGELEVRLLEDGRLVELIRAFNYTDPKGVLWTVPKKSTVDGASIPRLLWTLIGGPFEGRYRKASVVHDFYCDRRSRTWQAVHRVFYDAMITAGVSERQAKVLYGGVYWGGPRWSETVVRNARLRHPDDGPRRGGDPAFKTTFDADGLPIEPWPASTETVIEQYVLSEDGLASLAEEIARGGISLDEIEQRIDDRTKSEQPRRSGVNAAGKYTPLASDPAPALSQLWSDLGLETGSGSADGSKP